MSYSENSRSHRTKGTCPMDCACDDLSYNASQGPSPDFCFAKGTKSDAEHSLTTREFGERIWANMRPPGHFPRPMSPISARKVDIVRAQLMDKTRSVPVQPPTLMQPIGFYADSGRSKSGMSVQAFLTASRRECN